MRAIGIPSVLAYVRWMEIFSMSCIRVKSVGSDSALIAFAVSSF